MGFFPASKFMLPDSQDAPAFRAEVARHEPIAGSVAGAIRFQLEDPLFWPDLPEGQSAFVHRLVVARTWKGQGVSQALLEWAAGRTRELGRDALRLDCDASRTKLRQLYESCGFTLHSYRHVGPYYVSRYELLV